MNLFLVGWNLEKIKQARVLLELESMVEIFPQLDRETLWSKKSKNGQVFVASMFPNFKVIEPREYVYKDGKQVVFYSGLPIDNTGNFQAHKAHELSLNWENIDKHVDGKFCLIKVNFEPTYLEIINDINGIEQIFYWRQGEQWLLSNSIYLINKIKKLNGSFDFLGISSWLTQGFVGFNRTLKSGIKVIPNGQVWSWKSNDSEPKKENYFSISKLACSDRHEISHEKIKQLAEKMTFVQKILFKNFKSLESRLTGGLDSRVLVALNDFSGYSGKYYTFGNLSPADNLVSEKIVKNFHLKHKFYYTDIEEEFKNWQNYWWYLLRQNDGMVDYKEILFPDAKRLSKSVDRLNLTLHGGAGSIGKTSYYNSDIFEKPTKNIIVKKFADKNFSYPINLIKIHTYERVINKIKDLVEFYLKDNVPLIEIPCCLYVDQRVRRWEGIISRVGDPLGDSFSPFWGRDFIEAAFTIQLYQLKRKMLHGDLIYILSPKLLNFPFDSYRKVPEISISKGGNLKVKIFQKSKSKINKFSENLFQIKRKKSEFSFYWQRKFFNNQIEFFKQQYFENDKSIVWEFIDRKEYGRIFSKNFDPSDKKKYLKIIFRISSLIDYENSS